MHQVRDLYGFLEIDVTSMGVDQLRSSCFDELLLQLLFVLLGSNKKLRCCILPLYIDPSSIIIDVMLVINWLFGIFKWMNN